MSRGDRDSAPISQSRRAARVGAGRRRDSASPPSGNLSRRSPLAGPSPPHPSPAHRPLALALATRRSPTRRRRRSRRLRARRRPPSAPAPAAAAPARAGAPRHIYSRGRRGGARGRAGARGPPPERTLPRSRRPGRRRRRSSSTACTASPHLGITSPRRHPSPPRAAR